MAEVKMSNEVLAHYLTREKVLELVDFIIEEPKFDDDAERCFTLPLIACECLTSDQISIFYQHIFNAEEIAVNHMPVLDKILSFFEKSTEEKQKLNHTLGGYINKILSYWLLKEP